MISIGDTIYKLYCRAKGLSTSVLAIEVTSVVESKETENAVCVNGSIEFEKLNGLWVNYKHSYVTDDSYPFEDKYSFDRYYLRKEDALRALGALRNDITDDYISWINRTGDWEKL